MDVLSLLRDAPFAVASFVLGPLVPKDPKLIVVGGRQFGGNTRPVFEQAAEHGLEAYWLTARPEILAIDHPRVVSTTSIEGLRIALRAGSVVFTHSLGDFGPLALPSRKTRLFNVWHGMPIKRMSTADPDFWTRSYARRNVRQFKRYSGMFVTSEEMRRIFAETFLQPTERVFVTGQPRNDRMLSAAPPIEVEPPLPPHSRRIIHCPTYRPGEAARLFPFDDFDLGELEARLEALDALLFVRTHPNDPGRPERSARIIPFQGDVAPEITDYLTHFDALITDYSSVYYDYLLLDRPTIFLPYDLDRYRERPGFYVPFEEIVAGPSPTSQAEFLAAIEEALERPGAWAAERARMRDRVHVYRDEGATRRVLDVITRMLGVRDD